MSEARHDWIASLYAGHWLEPVVAEALGTRQEIATTLAAEVTESARGARLSTLR